ncbi:hypothetical protein [Streptomyces atratus]
MNKIRQQVNPGARKTNGATLIKEDASMTSDNVIEPEEAQAADPQ